MIGPHQLTTTCPNAIVQLAVPPQWYDEKENSLAFAVLPFAAHDVIESAERDGFAKRLDNLSTMVNSLNMKHNVLMERCVENGLLD